MNRESFARSVQLLQATRGSVEKRMTLKKFAPEGVMASYKGMATAPTWTIQSHPEMGKLYPGTEVIFFGSNPNPEIHPGDFQVTIYPAPGIAFSGERLTYRRAQVDTHVSLVDGRTRVLRPTLITARKEDIFIKEPVKQVADGKPNYGLPTDVYYKVAAQARDEMDVALKFGEHDTYISILELDYPAQKKHLATITGHLQTANTALLFALSTPLSYPAIQL